MADRRWGWLVVWGLCGAGVGGGVVGLGCNGDGVGVGLGCFFCRDGMWVGLVVVLGMCGGWRCRKRCRVGCGGGVGMRGGW